MQQQVTHTNGEITNEMDKDGVTALIPGSLVSVDSDGKVSGKTKEGVATLVVTDVKTGTKTDCICRSCRCKR